MQFENKKIAILGLGVEGMASARFLKKHGACVTVLDQRGIIEDIKILGYKDIRIQTGKEYLKNLDQFDMIVRSPGIRRNIPEILEAEKKGVVIISQTQLFFDLCPCEIIGVTGTKGKGTTSALIYEMLKKRGFDVYLGGNIGKPPFEFLDNLTTESKVVLELSSYQLQDLTKSPHIGVILMITQEHLAPDKKDAPHQNYHEDIQEYVEAKRSLVRFQKASDFAILNRDYPASNESDIHTNGQIFQVSRERGVSEQGCFAEDGKIVIRRKVAKRSNLDQGSTLTEVIDTKDILLPGKHNLENVCAAVMAAVLSGVSKENIVSVLKTFKGLEHRLELVGEVGGVRYYDDSFSTTPETAIAAIQAFKEPEVLILGGARKGSDFTELGRVICSAKNIRAIIGIGLEWPEIKSKIKNQRSKILMVEGAKDMKTIVAAASKIAQSGDVVLLSPACSSFDMFRNYKERGELFRKEVEKLIKT